MEPVWAIGLMTGTVLDGNIDIAMIRTDGERIDAFGPLTLAPYDPAVRNLLEHAVAAAQAWRFEGPEPDVFAEAERALTVAQADAVIRFLVETGFSPRDIAVIGFHGQTVLHRAPTETQRGQTRQLGDGALMAQATGITTAYDFRTEDMAAGGHGAPLAPVYHRALLTRLGAGPDTVILNLGGVGNLTWCDGAHILAFDTGPANAPINDWVRAHNAGDMDVDGALARQGRVDEARLQKLLEHPYLNARPPKSLDRFDFTADMASGLDLADGAATLTAFTAGAVAKALALLPVPVREIVVCGGGRHNPALMDALAGRTGARIVNADDVGLRGDGIEAECFAYLAVRRLRDLPISFPETTGVSAAVSGGRIAVAQA